MAEVNFNQKPLPVVPMRNAVLFPGVTFPISAGRAGTLRGDRGGHGLRATTGLRGGPAQRVGERVAVRALHDRHDRHDRLGPARPRRHPPGPRRQVARHRPALRPQQAGLPRGDRPGRARDAAARFAGCRRSPACTARRGSAPRSSASSSGLPDEAVEQILAEVDEPGRLADLVAGYLDMPVSPTSRSCSRRSRSKTGCGACSSTCSARSTSSRRRKTSSPRSRKRSAAGSARCTCASSSRRSRRSSARPTAARDEGLKELRAKLDALDLPEDARKEVDREWQRLTRIGRESMESQVIRTYLETIAELPWNARSDEKLDVPEAARVLDEDHYGLKDVKDRILEFLAVRQLGEEREKRRRLRLARADRRRSRSDDESERGARSARARAGSSSSPGLPASARPRSRSRSPARWGASTCASRSAARATRPTSAATAGPTSARCRDGSCRA